MRTPSPDPCIPQVKRFAQRYDVHVWLVAHPRQLKDWQGKAPTLYDISGSAHFINKVWMVWILWTSRPCFLFLLVFLLPMNIGNPQRSDGS